jgi:hypothetical protein
MRWVVTNLFLDRTLYIIDLFGGKEGEKVKWLFDKKERDGLISTSDYI